MIATTVIPFTSAAGSKYLIQLKTFESGVDFDIPVIDVTIALITRNERVIGSRDLIGICKIIQQ